MPNVRVRFVFQLEYADVQLIMVLLVFGSAVQSDSAEHATLQQDCSIQRSSVVPHCCLLEIVCCTERMSRYVIITVTQLLNTPHSTAQLKISKLLFTLGKTARSGPKHDVSMHLYS